MYTSTSGRLWRIKDFKHASRVPKYAREYIIPLRGIYPSCLRGKGLEGISCGISRIYVDSYYDKHNLRLYISVRRALTDTRIAVVGFDDDGNVYISKFPGLKTSEQGLYMKRVDVSRL